MSVNESESQDRSKEPVTRGELAEMVNEAGRTLGSVAWRGYFQVWFLGLVALLVACGAWVCILTGWPLVGRDVRLGTVGAKALVVMEGEEKVALIIGRLPGVEPKTFGLTSDGFGLLSFEDAGTQAVALVLGQAGNAGVRLGVRPKDGGKRSEVSLTNEEGKELVRIAVSADGSHGEVTLYDRDGKVSWQAPPVKSSK